MLPRASEGSPVWKFEQSLAMLGAMISRNGIYTIRAASILMAAILWAQPVLAQERMQIGTYRDWDAWVRTTGAKKECFVVSLPKSTAPRGVNRGDIFLTVTHRPAAKVRNEVNVVIGYPFRENSTATGAIGGQSFEMFTRGDSAWLYDSKSDARMIAAMKKGSRLIVKGVSRRGTNTTDRYSLIGFTRAYNAISQACPK